MSQVAKYCIELEWKAFHMDLNTIEAWMKANAGEHYSGNCGAAKLQLWFLEEPSQDVKELIELHWSMLDESSIEATNYKSDAQRKADAEAKQASDLASAVDALKKLGLTDDQIAALRG